MLSNSRMARSSSTIRTHGGSCIRRLPSPHTAPLHALLYCRGYATAVEGASGSVAVRLQDRCTPRLCVDQREKLDRDHIGLPVHRRGPPIASNRDCVGRRSWWSDNDGQVIVIGGMAQPRFIIFAGIGRWFPMPVEVHATDSLLGSET